MANPEALQSAFGQQPAALPEPDGSDELQAQIDAALASAPSGETISAPDGQGGAQPGMAETLPPEQADPVQAEIDKALTATDQLPLEGEDRSFLGSNFTPSGIMQQFANTKERIAASFGRTPKEQVGILRKMLGDQNVRLQGKDTLLIKKPGKNRFTKLEPDTFDIVGDLILDGFRDNLSFGAGAAAVAAQGPAAAEPISSAAGFAGGVAAGDALADYIVETVVGVPRDTVRGGVVGPDATLGEKVQASGERALENVGTGVLASAFNKLGTSISNKVSQHRSAIKQLKELDAIPRHELTNEVVKKNIQTMDALKEMDKIIPLKGGDMPMLAHQLAPHSNADEIAKSLVNNKLFQKAQEMGMKNMDDGFVSLVEEHAELASGEFRKALTSGSRSVGRDTIQQDMGKLLKKVRKAEGQIIDKFRTKAGGVAKTTPVPTPNTVQNVSEVSGLVNQVDELKFLRGTINDMTEQIQATQGTGLTIDQMNKYLKSPNYRAAIEFGMKSKDPNIKALTGKFASGLRSDLRDGMKYILSDADAKAYESSISKFRGAAKSQEALASLLRDDDMATNVFVQGLISKSRKGKSQLKAAKTFLMEEDPALWNKVSTEFFEELALKSRVGGKADKSLSFSTSKMRSELMKFDNEMLREMLPKGDPKMIFNALDLAQQLETTLLKGSDDEVAKATKSAIQATSSFVSAKLNTAHAFLKLGSNKNRLLKLMNRDGIEGFLENVPAKERGPWRDVFQLAIDNAITRGTLQTIGTVNRGAMQTVRGGQSVKLGSDISGMLNSEPEPMRTEP